MANFNEKVNCGIGYIQNSKEFLIYRRGSIVPCFRIPAEVFEHFFGLKENFPDQYEKDFGKTDDANPVQLERAMDAIKAALMDIEDQKCELGVMLAKLDDTLRKLK